jgi:hypothetical protein
VPTLTWLNLEPPILHLPTTQPSYPALPKQLLEDPSAGAVSKLPVIPLSELPIDAVGVHRLTILKNFQDEFPYL